VTSPVHVLEVIIGVLPRALDPICVDCYILPSLLITTLTTEDSVYAALRNVCSLVETDPYMQPNCLTTVVPGTTLFFIIAISASASC